MPELAGWAEIPPGRSGDQTLEANCGNENARGSVAAAEGAFFSKIAIICSIGVMPQIASFENGKLYEMAPINRPSM